MAKATRFIDPKSVSKGGDYKSKAGLSTVPGTQDGQVTVIGDQEDRRQTLKARRLVYENDWDDILTGELRLQFVQETFQNIRLMLDTSQNIFRRIVREICTVYKMPSKRELIRSETVVDVPRWDELTEQLKLNQLMNEAHRSAKASTVSFLRCHYVETKKKMILEIIPPDFAQVDLDPDDPLTMTGFGFRVKRKTSMGEDVEGWIYYTREKIYFLDSGGMPIKNPFQDEPTDPIVDNPYGIIPVVPFHATAPVKSFWRENWNKDAYRANILIGVLLTYMNFLVKTQSFKQLYFSADKVSPDMLNAVLDPLFPLPLPTGTTAGTLDLNTRLEAIDGVIRAKIISIANNYGISPENFTITGNVQSGFALKVANRALEEIRDADKPIVHDVERELFNVLRTVNNVQGLTPIPDDLELKWNPGEISYPPTWEEEEARWTFEFTHGITNQIDYMMADDPELSRDGAKKLLLQIREENDEIKPKLNLADQLFKRKEKGNAVQG